MIIYIINEDHMEQMPGLKSLVKLKLQFLALSNLMESTDQCHDAQVVVSCMGWNPICLTMLAAKSGDYTATPQHLHFRASSKLRDLGDVRDLREFSPRLQTLSFHISPMCVSGNLGDVGHIFKASLNCLFHTVKAFISLTL